MDLLKRKKQIMDNLQRVYAGVITHGDTIEELAPTSSPGLVMEEAQKALVGIAEAQANLAMAKMYIQALSADARVEAGNVKIRG